MVSTSENQISDLQLTMNKSCIEKHKNYISNPDKIRLQHFVIYIRLNYEPMRKYSFCLEHKPTENVIPDKLYYNALNCLDLVTSFIRNIIWVNWTHDAKYFKPSGMTDIQLF
jgi:hypothetical protein